MKDINNFQKHGFSDDVLKKLVVRQKRKQLEILSRTKKYRIGEGGKIENIGEGV